MPLHTRDFSRELNGTRIVGLGNKTEVMGRESMESDLINLFYLRNLSSMPLFSESFVSFQDVFL